MGYSIRSKDHRYTEWRELKSGKVLDRELYDHRKDPGETVNIAESNEEAKEVGNLSRQLQTTLNRASAPHPIHHPTSPANAHRGRPATQIQAQSIFKTCPASPHNTPSSAMSGITPEPGFISTPTSLFTTAVSGRCGATAPADRTRMSAPRSNRNIVPHHDLADTPRFLCNE